MMGDMLSVISIKVDCDSVDAYVFELALYELADEQFRLRIQRRCC